MGKKTIKPEDLITNNTLPDVVVGMEMVASSIALTAVSVARVEERNKALEAFEFTISQLPVHYDVSVIKQMRENFMCKL